MEWSLRPVVEFDLVEDSLALAVVAAVVVMVKLIKCLTWTMDQRCDPCGFKQHIAASHAAIGHPTRPTERASDRSGGRAASQLAR